MKAKISTSNIAEDNHSITPPYYLSPSGYEALALLQPPRIHPLQRIDDDKPVNFANLERDIGLLVLLEYRLLLRRFFPLNMDKSGNYIGDVNTYIYYRELERYINTRIHASEISSQN